MSRNSDYVTSFRVRRRQKIINYLGGKCVRCGSTENLQAHHINPSTKSFTIADNLQIKWETILEELKKCELLCSICHMNEHKSKAPHGTIQKYWTGCDCSPCKAANHEYYLKRRGELDPRTPSQIQMGKRKHTEASSKFKGVSYVARRGVWQAEITKNKQRYYLGRYKSEEDAAKAYDEKAMELFGEFARLNFPMER